MFSLIGILNSIIVYFNIILLIDEFLIILYLFLYSRFTITVYHGIACLYLFRYASCICQKIIFVKVTAGLPF
jgi:hypothetical protein